MSLFKLIIALQGIEQKPSLPPSDSSLSHLHAAAIVPANSPDKVLLKYLTHLQ